MASASSRPKAPPNSIRPGRHRRPLPKGCPKRKPAYGRSEYYRYPDEAAKFAHSIPRGARRPQPRAEDRRTPSSQPPVLCSLPLVSVA